MARLNVGLIGLGRLGRVYARDLAGRIPETRLVAVADPMGTLAKEVAEEFEAPRAYTDPLELIDDPVVEAIVIVTPTHIHREQVIAAADRKKPTFCEKPPALSLAELDGIAAAEQAGGGRFATVFQHRFGSGAQTLRGLVAAGDPRFGEPMTAVCHTLWYRPDDYFAVPWRGSFEVEGGGPTMGHGIHQIDLLLSILGGWQQVVAVAARRARPTATEDLSVAVVTMDSGAVVTIVNSLLSPREVTYLRFDFEHATVELEHLYGYSDEHWRVTATPGREAEVKAAWDEGPKGQASGHAAQLGAVVDALAAGTPPPVTLPDTRPTMELIAASYASAFTGAPVRRGEIGTDSPFYHRMDGNGAPWEATA